MCKSSKMKYQNFAGCLISFMSIIHIHKSQCQWNLVNLATRNEFCFTVIKTAYNLFVPRFRIVIIHNLLKIIECFGQKMIASLHICLYSRYCIFAIILLFFLQYIFIILRILPDCGSKGRLKHKI